MAIQDISNYSDFLFKTGIGGNNPQVEQYARSNNLSYEEAAVAMYRQGRVGTQSPEYGDMVSSQTSGTFFFDSAYEAEKAFGDLGPYYDRLLKESRGDINKAISRLTEDYDTGQRREKQDQAAAIRLQEISQEQQRKSLMNQGLQRGITSASAYEQPTGLDQSLGIFGQQKAQLGEVQDLQKQNLINPFLRGAEDQLKSKTRTEEDLRTKQTRYESELEQQRRREASELQTTRQQRAYTGYQANLM